MSERSPNFSEPPASKKKVQFSPKPGADTPSDLMVTGLSELAALARRAFEEKRRKNCVSLTNAILKIDPNHQEALVIQAWVNADLLVDLENARRLIKEAQARNSLASYDRAEEALHSILAMHPENQEVRSLLNDVIAAAGAIPRFESFEVARRDTPFPPDLEEDRDPASRKRALIRGILITVLALTVIGVVIGFRPGDRFGFFAGAADTDAGTLDIVMDEGVQVFVNDEYQGVAPLESLSLAPGAYLLRYQLDGQDIGEEQVIVSAGAAVGNTITSAFADLDLILVPATGVKMALDDGTIQTPPRSLHLKAGKHVLYFTAAGYMPESMTIMAKAGEQRNLVVTLDPSQTQGRVAAAPPPVGGTTQPARSRSAQIADQPPAQPASDPVSGPPGMLALSAAIPVEIYEGETLLGSTPTTLRLPPGTHTLEYRYRDLRKSESHVIRANQTTTVTVGFDVIVQMNARPFAQVFVDGVTPRSLGETPLSNVSIPAGSVLVFKHPNFPERRVRVTGSETSIQVVFQ